MKNVLFILALYFCTITGAMAQTEKGGFRLGGSTSVDFLNSKHAGYEFKASELNIDVSGGYFIIDNLSVDIGIDYNMQKESGDNNTATVIMGEAGIRYYLPVKVFFASSFNFLSLDYAREWTTGTAISLKTGYAWFVKDNIALEPSVGYRIGLSNKKRFTKYDQLSLWLGFSVYF